MNLPVRLVGALRLCACAIALAATAAHAGTYTVGIGSGCTHSTIQAALDTAAVNTGSTVRITRSATWSAQTLTVGGSLQADFMVIEGGYATCAQTASDGTYTTISGAGATGPVFTVSGQKNVSFRYLTIRDGNNSVHGGGIYMKGYGELRLANTTVQYNRADNGGGVYVDSNSVRLPKLVLDQNVIVSNNTANIDGGGVYLNGTSMSMDQSGSMLFGNTANNGYGGGLMIHADDHPASASIGSSGIGNLGAIYGNQARYGGGVAIAGASVSYAPPHVAELSVHGATIRGNSASTYGGGIYARSFESTGTGNIASAARLWRAELADNIAPYGAAVFLDRHAQPTGSGVGARLEIDYGASPGPACPGGDYCSRITGNAGPSPYNSPPIIMSSQGTVQIGATPSGGGGLLVSGNTGAFIGGSNNCLFYVNNVQITGNDSSAPIIGGACQLMEVNDATIAGNSIGSSAVISVDSDFVMQRSIVWQPGKTTNGAGIGGHAFADIVTSETTSLTATGAQRVVQADPWFIDPAHGNFGLQAASPAVDYAPALAGADFDAQGRPRNVDLPVKANTFGRRDLGALERQSLQPLVLNADFDFSDLRLWTWFIGSWDGTQNASGGTGSGSWKYADSNLNVSRVTVGEQCIHLPGPGHYRANGWGKGGSSVISTRDYAILGWEFRRNGSASCNGGAADSFGELYLGAGTTWGHPAQPAEIEVSAADWSTSSSIVLRLIAEDGGIVYPRAISAWFDGITLDVISLDDRIFADGFQ